jgi:hypothetical protein
VTFTLHPHHPHPRHPPVRRRWASVPAPLSSWSCCPPAARPGPQRRPPLPQQQQRPLGRCWRRPRRRLERGALWRQPPCPATFFCRCSAGTAGPASCSLLGCMIPLPTLPVCLAHVPVHAARCPPVQFKLTDGQHLRASFPPEATLQQVVHHLDTHRTGGWQLGGSCGAGGPAAAGSLRLPHVEAAMPGLRCRRYADPGLQHPPCKHISCPLPVVPAPY